MDAARQMYRNEGFLSFYSGLTPALLGLAHVAVQFPAYEYLKTKFTGKGMGESHTGGEVGHYIAVMGASFLSKILASAATYPHEVIRTRLQTQQRGLAGKPAQPTRPRYKGIIVTTRTILREEGWRAFYAGMGTNMMRAVPAAVTTMLTYEYAVSTMRKAKEDGLQKWVA
jgi:solute carrier family 25 folate transporter 32